MSGAHPEIEAKRKIEAELSRLEGERTKRPRKGSLAWLLAHERQEAEKALHAAEVRLANARKAESIYQSTPGLSEKQLRALMKGR